MLLNTDARTLFLWTECPSCNTLHDRDMNAAMNILAEGLRILSEGELGRVPPEVTPAEIS